MNRVLSRTISRNALGLITASVAVVTAWSGIWAWIGGNYEGMGWTNLGSSLIGELLSDFSHDVNLKSRLLSHKTLAELSQSLDADEIVKSGLPGSKTIRSRNSIYSEAEAGRIIPSTHPGFFLHGKSLFYLSKLDIPEENLYLAKPAAEIVQKLGELTQAEFALLDLEGAALQSTLRDLSGNTLLPTLDRSVLEKPQRIQISVPGYGGFRVPGFDPLHRGADSMSAFVATRPVMGPSGQPIAFLGMIAPADLLLGGVRTGILGSILLGFLLCLISIFVGRRSARRISVPLTRAADRIRGIASSLSASLGVVDSHPIGNKKVPYPELANLEHAVELFEHVYGRTEAMQKALDEERSKTFASSKLAALGEMAGGVAHEINSPLAIISTLAGQLKELAQENALDTGHVQETSAQIEQTAFRIAKIVNGLRSFSRNASRDPFIPVSVRQIVSDTTAFCTQKFKHHGVTLVVKPIADVAVECRPSEIAQILLNLLNNSLEAVQTLPERWTRISMEDAGEQVRIRIEDSGSGIPEPIAQKLFQPFFTTKEIGKGTGLGLGISRKIAEHHGGNLEIDPHSKHTTFVLSLPKKHARPEVKAA